MPKVPETPPKYSTTDKGIGTVGELISRLRHFPSDMPVGLALDDAGGELEILSIYATAPGTPGSRIDGKETLWIDLGERA